MTDREHFIPAAELDPAGPGRVISIKAEQAHGHLRVHIWIGQDNAPGKVGELLMRAEDWFDLCTVLSRPGRLIGPAVRIRYEPGTELWLDSVRADAERRAGR